MNIPVFDRWTAPADAPEPLGQRAERLRREVIRERKTEARVRAMDAHEIVTLVHEMEDQRDAAHARAERLEVALRHIAGISNECTWHAHTRKLAVELQDTIRAALATQEGRDGE